MVQVQNICDSQASSGVKARIQIYYPLKPVFAKDLEIEKTFKGSFEHNLR